MVRVILLPTVLTQADTSKEKLLDCTERTKASPRPPS